jgi:hypothetical protein
MEQEAEPLARWDPARAECFFEVLADPKFPVAARGLASRMAAIAAANPMLEETFKDAGRYMAAMGMVYLHGLGELTLPRLKELCAASGFLSPGRVRDLLNVMQHLRYIEAVSSAAGASPARYAPSPEFLAAWYGHHRAALEAASLLEPALPPLLGRVDPEAFVEAFSRIHVGSLFATARSWGDDAPFMRVFLHRRAGINISWALLSAGGGADFPPLGPIPFPPSEFARRFGVSRNHVKRMQEDAVQEQILRPCGSELFEFEAEARMPVQLLYAGQLIFLLSAARQAIAELGLAPGEDEGRVVSLTRSSAA